MVITKKADYQGLRRERRPRRDDGQQPQMGTRDSDRRFSVWVRERDEWTCRRCHGDFSERRDQLTCSHFVNVRYSSTRYEPDNCVALCIPCHTGSATGWEYQKHDGGAYKVFMQKLLGPERFAQLMLWKLAHVSLDAAKAEFWRKLREGTL